MFLDGQKRRKSSPVGLPHPSTKTATKVEKRNSILYRVGFNLYFVGLLLFIGSVTIPGVWIYDQETALSNTHHGRSIWDLDVRICFGSRDGPWRCGQVFAARDKLIASACFLCLGIVTQLSACVILTSNFLGNTHIVGRFFSESLAGFAVLLSLTGVLIYVSVTHFAVNVIYGPGVAMNITGILLTYLGFLLTGMYNTVPEKTDTRLYLTAAVTNV